MPTRIAIIEDDPASLDLMRYLLGHSGFTTLCAVDGEAGLGLIRKERPALVVCDLQLPLMDGYQIARAVKADPELKSIPLIAVSAFSMPGDEEKGFAAGFLAYYVKPIDPESFVEKMKQHLPPALRGPGQSPDLQEKENDGQDSHRR